MPGDPYLSRPEHLRGHSELSGLRDVRSAGDLRSRPDLRRITHVWRRDCHLRRAKHVSGYGDLCLGEYVSRRLNLRWVSDLCIQQHLRLDRDLSRYTILRRHDHLSGYVDLCWPGNVSGNEHLHRDGELRGCRHLRAEPDVQRHRVDVLQ